MAEERFGDAAERILRERFWSEATPPTESAPVVDLAAWRARSALSQR